MTLIAGMTLIFCVEITPYDVYYVYLIIYLNNFPPWGIGAFEATA